MITQDRSTPTLRCAGTLSRHVLEANANLGRIVAGLSEVGLEETLTAMRIRPRYFLNEPAAVTEDRMAVRNFEAICRTYYSDPGAWTIRLRKWLDELGGIMQDPLNVSTIGRFCVCIDGRIDGAIFANCFLLLKTDTSTHKDPDTLEYMFALCLFSQTNQSYLAHMVSNGSLRGGGGGGSHLVGNRQ